MLLLAFVLAGLAIGFLRGGSLANLIALDLRHVWLIPLGLLLQVIAFFAPLPEGGTAAAVHLLSYGVILAAIALNLHLRPLLLLGLGTLGNLAAIVTNGGYMPASPQSLLAAGMEEELRLMQARGHLAGSTLQNENTNLAFLGDVLAAPAWLPLANVFSVGDLLIGLGALLLVAQAMGRSTAATPSADAAESPAGWRRN